MVYYPAEPESKSVSVPIYMASNFEYDADIYQRVLDEARKSVNIYSRCGNSGEYTFDDQVALIENADGSPGR
jgi:O-acetylhomoserine/O-acetylserine sulfhydrylase-like pyridoxal-dependent enzyme